VSTWKKYLLLQIPGWLATATVLAVLWHWQLLSRGLALLCFFAWVAKDLILYPFLRHAYEDGAKSGSAALVGARGVAQEDLNPSGYVRVRGELWRAVAVPADQVVTSGADVEIVQAERMTVFVRSVENLGRR
jgi:membrane protein implicated in regulation of membrane protease activity